MATSVQHFTIDHIETVRREFAQKTGTHSNIVQLTPGGLAYSGTWVELPGIRIEWNALDSRIRSRDRQDDWGLLFGFALPGSSALSFRGFPVEGNMGFLYREGTYMDYVAGPGARTLIVCVHRDLVQDRAWRLGPGAFRQVTRSGLTELESTCRRITERDKWNDTIERSETNSLLDCLDQVLEQWMVATDPPLPPKQGAFHFEVVEAVEKVWTEAGSGRPPPVRELITRIGIPERTLFHAFQQALGIGPVRYLKLLQLHRLRDELLEADPQSASVAEIAHGLGYEQLGQMAAYYKRHFTDLPSQSLSRQLAGMGSE